MLSEKPCTFIQSMYTIWHFLLINLYRLSGTTYFYQLKNLSSCLNFLVIMLQCVLMMFEACQFLSHIIIQFQYLLCLNILNAFIFFNSPVVWNRISLFNLFHKIRNVKVMLKMFKVKRT